MYLRVTLESRLSLIGLFGLTEHRTESRVLQLPLAAHDGFEHCVERNFHHNNGMTAEAFYVLE